MPQTQWHLDKRVPVAIIVTIILNTGMGIWFAAKLDSRVTDNTAKIGALATKSDEVYRTLNTLAVTMGRVDERLKSIKDTVDRISKDKP